MRLVSRLHQSASPDYGMTSWKYADNSGYPTPDLSSQPPQCRAETGADVPNLATLARVVYPEAPQIPPRLLVAAPESQK
ncbi:MAG TPA: hypothetical protein VL285_25755 [Bryobacteraceae bacterium]|nr:hypothetical protein [Bryobacteraceae bacterium]